MTMLKMSYEMSTLAVQSNPSSVAVRSEPAKKWSPRSGEASARVKRFSNLPAATQEKVLAYGENLLKYLEEEKVG